MLVQATHFKTFCGQSEHVDVWHNLATGIIKQACIDDYHYRYCIRKEQQYLEKTGFAKQQSNGNHTRALKEYEFELSRIKKFFYGDYFILLARCIDGPSLYRQLAWNFEHGIRPVADHKKPYKKKNKKGDGHEEIEGKPTKYCPNCGVNMRGEQDD